MIDIHTHIIFDVDDGSDTLEESVAILKSAVLNGVTDIVCTPHYLDSYEYNLEKVLANFETLKEAAKGLNIKLHLGNEVAVYGNIGEILSDVNVKGLANSKYMLIEFPMSTDVDYVEYTIYEMRIKGIIPIIAHPERCECFKKHIDRVSKAIEEGALIQCNTGSILGKYGNTAKKIVKKLLKERLVHFMATDTHNTKRNGYENLDKAEAEIEKIIGRCDKNKLFIYNARYVLADQELNKEV